MRRHRGGNEIQNQTKPPSLRARIIRFGLRKFLKGRLHADTSIEEARREVQFMTALVPRPPRSTKTDLIDVGGVKAERVSVPESRLDRHLLYLHGGSYSVGSPALYRDILWRIGRRCRAVVWCLNYRLAPEHPFPAALDDAIAAYRFLIAQGDPHRLAIAGDSAGGGLALATLLRLRDDGLPLPVAAAVISPWTDLALMGESLSRNADLDPFMPVELAPRAVDLYLAGADPRNPYASPLYGDPTGLPPALILVGGDEVLLDDSVRMAKKMRAAGCDVEIEVWPHMWHVWPTLVRVMPEARAALARFGNFLHDKL